MGNLDCIENKDVEPMQGYELLPKGEYRAEIANSEVVPTVRGDGLICKVKILITQEPYQGRWVFHNFNVKNPSEKAQQIGRGQLSALNAACTGKPGIPNDSTDLHELPFLARIDIEPANGEYAAKNKVIGFYPLNKGRVSALQATAQTKVEDDNIPF